MAEMTKDMYGAIGKVGNKTYYQRMGKTIVRTITRPKNPKTELLCLQLEKLPMSAGHAQKKVSFW